MLLGAMVIVLLGVGHLFNGKFATHKDEIEKLRKDVQEHRDVVSRSSAFGPLFARHNPTQSK